MAELPLRPLKWYKALATARGRKEAGSFLVEGVRQVRQLLLSGNLSLVEVLLEEGKEIDLPGDVPVRVLTPAQLRGISDAEAPGGIVGVAAMPADVAAAALPLVIGRVLFLEDIQDPGNVGTLIRSAAAFGFAGVILTPGCADPFSPKVVRASGGALGALWLRRSSHAWLLLQQLRGLGYLLVTADSCGGEAVPLAADRLVLALGNEGNGVSPQLRAMSDRIWTIPFVAERIESLNVAVAGSICMSRLYEAAGEDR
ncbi:MAG: RNA methyltransferase [Thermodesulfobacteriota bacterium]